VLELFNYKAKNVLKVAGLSVQSGMLKTSNKYIFRVKRPIANIPVAEGVDPPVADEYGYVTILPETSEAHLKRFKDVVHEVNTD
jgi:hypothetical protein